MQFRIGCVPLQWGKWRRESPEEWPESRVLREVREAGYEGISSGPREGKTPQGVVASLAEFGLSPAPGYLGAEFWKPDVLSDILEQAKRQAAFAAGMGLTEFFVAPNGGSYVSRANGKTRQQLAGQVGPDDGLTDDEYHQFADALNAVGQATLAEGSVRICFHNHVGLAIETEEETARLIDMTDPALVFLGPDTGHLAWAGADPVAFCRRYAGRIKALHLKDINPAVREQGVREAWNYGTFSAHGIFAELGEGPTNFATILDLLKAENFDGWLLSETDVTQKASPLESARLSRDHLKTLGV